MLVAKISIVRFICFDWWRLVHRDSRFQVGHQQMPGALGCTVRSRPQAKALSWAAGRLAAGRCSALAVADRASDAIAAWPEGDVAGSRLSASSYSARVTGSRSVAFRLDLSWPLPLAAKRHTFPVRTLFDQTVEGALDLIGSGVPREAQDIIFAVTPQLQSAHWHHSGEMCGIPMSYP
jgi:hypothetical protein